ncbi:MAG: hypothetical protein LBM00_04880 [Deltaproteobacteria bacterium]|jgi:hypothetical protein|nr:hypothetical protein [Deltaproteobacteria bacterium]
MNTKAGSPPNDPRPKGKISRARGAENAEGQIRELAEELVGIADILVREFAALPQGNRENAATVLIARLVPGLDQRVWKQLAKKHALDAWLSIPVGQAEGESAASIASALGDILSAKNREAMDEFTSRRCMVRADEKQFLFSYRE